MTAGDLGLRASLLSDIAQWFRKASAHYFEVHTGLQLGLLGR